MVEVLKKLIQFLKILKISKNKIIIIYISSILSSLLFILHNICIKLFFNKSEITQGILFNKYLYYFLWTIFFYTLSVYIKKYLFLDLNINIDKNFNNVIEIVLNRMEIEYIYQNNEAEIIEILTNKKEDIIKFFEKILEKIICTPINFILSLIGIILIDYKLSFFLIPSIFIGIYLDITYSSNLIKNSKMVIKKENQIISLQKEIIENAEKIQILKNEEYIYRKFKKYNEDYLKSAYKMLKSNQISYIPSLLNEYLPLIILIIFSLYKVSKNEIDYGMFISSLNLILGISLPFSHFLRTISQIKYFIPKINEVMNLIKNIEINEEIVIRNKQIKNNIIIDIKKLSYKYENNYILKEINMLVEKNDKIGIIGKSGSGKSTLARIILGIHKNIVGEIKIFGDIPNKTIWNKIGYVDNNMYIFKKSLKYNITLLERELNITETKKFNDIIKKLNLEDLLNKDLLQFGLNISGGQKLKINIARALFKNSELLILDEPLGALDENSEKVLSEIISEIDKTVLIITHRLKILEMCNKVYEINKNGELIKIKDFRRI